MGLSYFHCGSWLGYTMYTFNLPDNNHRNVLIWPQALVMTSALIAGSALAITRAFTKRIPFIHFYLMAVGSLFMLISGLVLIINLGKSHVFRVES